MAHEMRPAAGPDAAQNDLVHAPAAQMRLVRLLFTREPAADRQATFRLEGVQLPRAGLADGGVGSSAPSSKCSPPRPDRAACRVPPPPRSR